VRNSGNLDSSSFSLHIVPAKRPSSVNSHPPWVVRQNNVCLVLALAK
jgi:hypothetical protein